MYKRVWRVGVDVNKFMAYLFVESTESRLVDFLNSEVPGWFSYTGATEQDVKNAKALGLPVYLA